MLLSPCRTVILFFLYMDLKDDHHLQSQLLLLFPLPYWVDLEIPYTIMYM